MTTLTLGRLVKWLHNGGWQTGRVLMDPRCNLPCGDEDETLVQPSCGGFPCYVKTSHLTDWEPRANWDHA